MEKMEYESFRKKCMKMLRGIYGNEYDVQFEAVRQNDEIIIDSIAFHKKSMKTGNVPSIRLKPYYDEYCKGKSLDEIMAEIDKTLETYQDKIPYLDASIFDSWETVKSRLIIRPISYHKNKKLLREHIYRRNGDIALTLYCHMGEANGQTLTSKMPKETALSWGKDEDALYEHAIINTNAMYPPILLPLEGIMGGVEGIQKIPRKNKFFTNLLEVYELMPSRLHTYYLSIDKGVNGAVAAFYPGVLDRLCGIFKDDLYLTFGNVREALLHPVSKMDLRAVKNAAAGGSKNPYVASELEYLSDNVYIYRRAEQQLTMLS